jgi:hypothetical protein
LITKAEEAAMEIYVPNDLLKTVSEVLTAEKVAFQVTDKVYSLMVEDKKIAEVTALNAQLLETDVPLIYDQGPEITLRAFRLPSGRKFLITDAKGNLVRLVEAPPGWER